MSAIDEQILRAAKEITLKFIEGGRISPSGFQQSFGSIYSSIRTAVKGPAEPAEPPSEK
jgi:hypothetical protein